MRYIVMLVLMLLFTARANAQTGYHDHEHGPGPCKWCEQHKPAELVVQTKAPDLTPPTRRAVTPVWSLTFVGLAAIALFSALVFRRIKLEQQRQRMAENA